MTDSRASLKAKTVKQLFELRRQMKSTLSNPNCAALTEPVNATITAIDEELATRGLVSIIRTQPETIYIQICLN